MMMHDSSEIPPVRRLKIAARLSRGESVSASALAAEFGVSEDAIRRDLRILAREGRCLRVYGGALPTSPASTPLRTRANEDLARKRALAQAALPLLRPGQTIFLDVGSTTLQLAGALPRGLDLRVATNSLPAATALADRSDIRLFVLGGEYDADVGGFVDARAAAELSRYRFDLCFLGACAVSLRRGLAGFDRRDVECKRAAIAVSDSVALLLATPKIETAAPFVIGRVADLRHVVIEPDAPEEVAAALLAAGLDVLRAEAPAAHSIAPSPKART